MKRLLLCALLLTSAIATAAAQNMEGYNSFPQWKRGFSIEAGAGIPPLHMFLLNRWGEDEFADKGQDTNPLKLTRQIPSFSLSAVWRTGERSEWVLSLCASRMRYSVTQYSIFGTDPDGKPRYDLTDGKDAGYAHSPVIPALSASYRGIWYSDKPWEVYSAIGLGLIFIPDGDPGWLLPLPAVTPFGVRVGGEHFYGFLESTFSPAATFIHGGVGWHF